MREILFRGKRKDNGKWVYGFLLKLSYPEMKSMRTFIITEDVAVDMTDREIIGDDESIFEIIPETVKQYTGIQNIYEGDIVIDRLTKIRYLIVWKNGAFWLCPLDDMYEALLLSDRMVSASKIGNKWDNPELLER